VCDSIICTPHTILQTALNINGEYLKIHNIYSLVQFILQFELTNSFSLINKNVSYLAVHKLAISTQDLFKVHIWVKLVKYK